MYIYIYVYLLWKGSRIYKLNISISCFMMSSGQHTNMISHSLSRAQRCNKNRKEINMT